MLRGAFGLFLKRTAPPDVYSRIFEPGRDLGPAPSGLGDWPRPFVFRAHLDGLDVPAHDFFSFDLHLFELRQPVLTYFQEAFTAWAAAGIGPARRRARLDHIEQVGIDGLPNPAEACSLSLDPEPFIIDRVTVRFLTPTELKTAGAPAGKPAFGVLFARLRDRICTLRSLYGQGPIGLDFRGMGERAAAVSLVRSELIWERTSRTSSRTSQTHPLGGFTGAAEYQGVLAEFVPWLRAARWTGVGRQTVWGKGEIRVIVDARRATSGSI